MRIFLSDQGHTCLEEIPTKEARAGIGLHEDGRRKQSTNKNSFGDHWSFKSNIQQPFEFRYQNSVQYKTE